MRRPLDAPTALLLLCTAVAVLCAVLMGCGGAGRSPAAPDQGVGRVVLPPLPEVPMHGYYLYDGRHLAEVAPWTNWALLYTTTVERSREVAAEARSLRVRVCWTPFRGEATSPTWDRYWESNKDLIRPFADAGVLHSVYVADEPMAAGWGTYDELAHRVSMVHAEGWKATMVEQGGGIDRPRPAVDYYGMDWYGMKARVVRGALQRHPEVTFYVGAAFTGPEWETVSQEGEADVASAARVQLVWWMWPTVGPWVGAGDNPEMQSEHRQIAARLGVAK